MHERHCSLQQPWTTKMPRWSSRSSARQLCETLQVRLLCMGLGRVFLSRHMHLELCASPFILVLGHLSDRQQRSCCWLHAAFPGSRFYQCSYPYHPLSGWTASLKCTESRQLQASQVIASKACRDHDPGKSSKASRGCSAGDRRSRRSRKGRAVLRVSADTRLQALRLNIAQELGVHPQNARIHALQNDAWVLLERNDASLRGADRKHPWLTSLDLHVKHCLPRSHRSHGGH